MKWDSRKTEKAAQRCGMTPEQWATARKQVQVNRTRGRREPGTTHTETNDRQIDLFTTEQ